MVRTCITLKASSKARTPTKLAAQLTATTRQLRAALKSWDTSGAVPRDVTYLALHHQRMLRFMSARRKLGDATLDLLPGDVRAEARDTVLVDTAGALERREVGCQERHRHADQFLEPLHQVAGHGDEQAEEGED